MPVEQIVPIDMKIPAKISRLPQLAYNLWWSWTPQARGLFSRLDYPLWRQTHHNPVQMLRQISAERLKEAAKDSAFLRQYERVMIMFDHEMVNGHTWFQSKYADLKEQIVAYFSFEFGLHNSLPIYSGGLGILSGDHAKEASDLGLPFIGVGFMYPQGYFRQRIPAHGWQEAVYEQLEISQAPVLPAVGTDGEQLAVTVSLAGRSVHARVWCVQVGRVPLYMLDTDVDENDPWDRELSARLYSGDSEMRIRQEIMLGVGGVRVIRALGIEPAVWHMNEGHSAFLLLENVRHIIASERVDFDQAWARVGARSIFTTHTPVPAGHDAFNFHMVENYFRGFWDELGITRERFLSLGGHDEVWGTAFNMTVLALRGAGQSNGVSRLHGEVSRKMWKNVWQIKNADDVPITSITNGVHLPTWVAGEMHHIFDKYLGPAWRTFQDDPTLWQRLKDVPDRELWNVHLSLKRKLISHLQELARRRWINGQNDPTQVLTTGTLLDPEALTIGFARRFATYKRATLVFRHLERLEPLLLDIHRPVQLLFAGKAHPADDTGKSLIQHIYNLAKHSRLGGRVAFVEDYDMHMARYLTQGVDVWLNTPRRPREASGTSGMKAALNGIPSLSVLDGWWAEAYNGANGWAIDSLQFDGDQNAQDEHDANALYQLLEDEVMPLYYSRDRDNVPRGWVEIMREAILSNAPQFSMRRMIKEYTEQLYVTAMKNGSPGQQHIVNGESLDDYSL